MEVSKQPSLVEEVRKPLSYGTKVHENRLWYNLEESGAM